MRKAFLITVVSLLAVIAVLVGVVRRFPLPGSSWRVHCSPIPSLWAADLRSRWKGPT